MTLLLRVLIPLLLVALIVATVADVLRIAPERVRGLPRVAWVVIVVALPALGALLWYTIGRAEAGEVRRDPRAHPQHPAGTNWPPPHRAATRSGAPDDDPEFLAQLGTEAQQARRIRELEARLRELGEGAGAGDGAGEGEPASASESASELAEEPDARDDEH